MTLVTKPYADQIARDRGEAMDRIIQMNDTPTPRDSAMTADIERALKWLRQWIVDITIPQLHRAEFAITVETIERLTTERTKLAADLARVEGERDRINDAAMLARGAAIEACNEMDAANARALAAEAKSARLAEALKSARATLKQFERHEKLLFEITGDEEFDKSQLAICDLLRDEINRITVALTLPEPSHEP